MLLETESARMFFEFIATYVSTKTLDSVGKNIGDKLTDCDLSAHIFSVLSDSLLKFCENHSIECDTDSIINSFVQLCDSKALALNNANQLKNVFKDATGLSITPEEAQEFDDIVLEQVIHKEHEPLYRAIILQHIKNVNEQIHEQPWLKKYLVDNYFELFVSEDKILDLIFEDVETDLTDVCWLNTRQLLAEILLNSFEHGASKENVLRITENTISIISDGVGFDPTSLLHSKGNLSGGSWTICFFKENYPEVPIKYEFKDGYNITSIVFPDNVFHVNLLCEIEIPEPLRKRALEIKLRYEDSRARYYYIDFSKSDLAKRLFCMSGIILSVEKLIDFCNCKNAELFLYVPNKGEAIYDNLHEQLKICIDNKDTSNKLHLIRE